MEINGSYTYGVPIEAVIGLLGDASATVSKYETMGHRQVKVEECEAQSDTLRVVSSRTVDVDLPGFAKRVLRPTNTMHQTDEWRRQSDGSWQGTFDIQVQGAPIHMSGTMSLTPAGDQTVHDVSVRVEVKVPVVGGRIADWAAKGDVRRNVDGEFSFNDSWLHQHV